MFKQQNNYSNTNMLNKNYEIDEKKLYQFWLNGNYFKSTIDSEKEPYCIVIPPPNCTGNLHVGHALNNTFQDILIRAKKLQGYNTCWIPGTDHGGIATQNVVEKLLLNEGEGITKEELGREEFLKKVWEWKESKRSNIINQLKELGCACDWDREQFTMSAKLSSEVRKAFHKLYNDGLVYKSNYIVNWCPRCQTALSDDEVEHKNTSERKDADSQLYYIRYPLSNSSVYIIIATTRPETILGDTAVAYNPTDERHNMFKGMKVTVPIVNREVDLIEDDYVKKEFGTGFVKITPCHDKNDYTIGKNHNLDFINIIDEKGVIQNTNTQYDGMDRFECRKQILIELSDLGLLDKVEKHENSVGHCYRCDTIIEPRISDQWFVKMQGLMEKGLSQVEDGNVSLSPEFHKDIYKHWMTSDVDWCISRQIWWGHQIPILYCQNEQCKYHTGFCPINDHEKPTCCDLDMIRETDVLDTWFSSALWAFSVFETKEEEDYYFPTNTLVTGSDILFFWVARMVMMTDKLKNAKPFNNVYLHGVVRDKDGVKMSKTLGNVIDPLDIIEEHSADILRFTLAYETPFGQDVKIEMKTFNLGKTFCTKLWNSMRYILLNLPEDTKLECNFVDYDFLDNTDKWIINKLNITITEVTDAIESFDFSAACKKIYEFLWEHFCPVYLEYAKTSIDEQMTQKILLLIIDNLIRLLHPFVPFLTEEIWQIIKKYFDKYDVKNSILECSWPQCIDIGVYMPQYDDLFEIHRGVLSGIRKIRSEYNVNKKEYTNKLVNIVLQSDDHDLVNYIKHNQKPIFKLGKVEHIIYNNFDENKKYIKHKIAENLIVAIEVDERFDFQCKIDYIEKLIAQRKKKITKIEDHLRKSTAAPDSKKRRKKQEEIQDIQQSITDMEREITSLKIMGEIITLEGH